MVNICCKTEDSDLTASNSDRQTLLVGVGLVGRRREVLTKYMKKYIKLQKFDIFL